MLKLYKSWKPQLNNSTKQQSKTIKSASSKSLNQNKNSNTENLASQVTKNKNNQLSQNKNSNQKSFGELNPISVDSEDENDTK